MADEGHTVTDATLKKLERRIDKVYAEASIEMGKTTRDYFSKFAKRELKYSETLQKMVDSGKMSQKEADQNFKQWRINQEARGERYEVMRDKLAKRANEANKVAASYINDATPGIYSLNRNYAAYEIEKHHVPVDFTLFDERTVKRLVKSAPDLMPNYDPKPTSINYGKDIAYGKKQITAAVTSGILQGKSLGRIADDLQKRITGMNRVSALRSARTAVTGAQNAGRLDTYKAAQQMGIDMKKQWMATLDERTRASHGRLDGETIAVNKKFSNGLMYPGDRTGHPREVYNCRCTMISVVAGSPVGNRLTYSEWMDAKLKKEKEAQELIDLSDKIKDLNKQLEAVQKELNDVQIKTYSGIWKEDVTTADYSSLNMQGKKDYYEYKLKNTTDPDKLKQFQGYYDQLKELESEGKKYEAIADRRNSIEKEIKKAEHRIKVINGEAEDAFSQERKDAALWAKDTKEADKLLRSNCGKIWKAASKAEKDAIYDYTNAFSKFNEPLRGIVYGTNEYKGPGKIDLDEIGINYGGFARGEVRKEIDAMTDLIDKSSYDEDIWLQRGCEYKGMDKFLGVSPRMLMNGTQEELEKELLGKAVTDGAFYSCGVAKGKGFSDKPIIINTYAPAGTKMMYAEPFSFYGFGSKRSWDGESEQSSFGTESEMILQNNTTFRITKVERTPRKIFLDVEVIEQNPQR